MNIDDAFRNFDDKIRPSWWQRDKAKARRAHFTAVLSMLHSGIEVRPSGSLARDTSLDPIHDVDLILVLPDDLRGRFDAGPGSAQEVLKYVADLIVDALPSVRRAEPRNHVVKCYLDSRLATDTEGWRGFAVEVMPAFEVGSGLRVPKGRQGRWHTVDPANLIAASHRRQQEWPHYLRMVRLLKDWSREHPELHISSLAMEVLALRCLPHPPFLGGLSQAEALASFFTAAASEVMRGVYDPAGLSGEIAPGLRRSAARDEFLEMADLAGAALEWAKSDHPEREDIAIHFLRKIFGDRFQKPKRNWKQHELDAWQHDRLKRPEPIKVPPDIPMPRAFPDGPDTGEPGPGRRPPRGPAWPPGGPDPNSPPGGFGRTAPRRPRPGGTPGQGGDPGFGSPGRPPTGGGTGGGRPSGGGRPTGGGTEGGAPTGAGSGGGAGSGSRFQNATGHRAVLGAAAAVAAPLVVRPEDPAG